MYSVACVYTVHPFSLSLSLSPPSRSPSLSPFLSPSLFPSLPFSLAYSLSRALFVPLVVSFFPSLFPSCSASIEKYLLEKSRIISQAPGERNYHVFYYLLAGADTQLRRTLKLLQLNEYYYLTQVIHLDTFYTILL